MENIDLLINEISKLYVNSDALEDIKIELEEFLKDIKIDDINMDSIKFAKDVMLSEEIKSNNLVEGYLDDIEHIDQVVKNSSRKKDAKDNRDQRILNLYKGYKYILKSKDINEESLKLLYNILSRNLLSIYDLEHMGEYYRNGPVYIFNSSDITKEPDGGINHLEIKKYMDELFSYINRDNSLDTKTDYYIKSQIIHFYFVYIHPYFDVNGRTSRTMSMWYLLNSKVYPYIIFNRGINFDKSTYYRAIMETIKYGNITIFLKYMLETVKIELEKEYLISKMETLTGKLTVQEKQTINYILSMKQQKNLKTFHEFYKRFNDPKGLKNIHESLIEPLLDKKILTKGSETKTKIYDGSNNFNFEINSSLLDNDPSKIRRLILQ